MFGGDIMQKELATIEKIYSIVTDFTVNYSFQILGAILILIIGVKIAGWLSKIVANFSEKKKIDITLARFFGNVVKMVVLTFVFIVVIGKFGISIAPFIAALGALAFGASFAVQGPLSNYGAGLVIILTRPFIVGNTITVKGIGGVVDEIRLAATILSTEDGEEITIPNKHIVGEILRNSFANRIVETTVGISYKDDPQKAILVVKKTLDKITGVCQDPSPQIGIQEFGDSSINIGMRYWIPTKKYFQTLFNVNLEVHQALLEAEITIPFPQRDIHLSQKQSGADVISS
jgi:small conductance mechanosensitive channel